ncbi:MAG: SLC13 family permease [Bacillota bacterium]|nr:SLC13 family permease [Bacillota bacterium]
MRFIKKNAFMCIAFLCATITCIIVPPDKSYANYFDLKTLTCLFCILAVVCAFKDIHLFQIVAGKIVCMFKNTRSAILALVYITLIGSMLITNDMALITFLPLSYFVLTSTNNSKYMAFTFIMQDIAANLGGMIAPFGNPQNLYLYTYFNIPNNTFIRIMFLPFIISVFLITICCLFVKKEPLIINDSADNKLNKKRAFVYTLLLALSVAIVFRFIPYYYGLIIIVASLLLMDKKALLQVDYPLILTFCAFFVFSGNMARIPEVHNLLGKIVEKNTLLSGVLASQVISNVPSAILLSKFTDNYGELLVAVNIGGAGTLIASLASLITYREFIKIEPEKSRKFITEFSVLNFGFLFVLTVVMYFVI